VIAAAALGWAAMQTDRTVAEVLSELDDLMPG